MISIALWLGLGGAVAQEPPPISNEIIKADSDKTKKSKDESSNLQLKPHLDLLTVRQLLHPFATIEHENRYHQDDAHARELQDQNLRAQKAVAFWTEDIAVWTNRLFIAACISAGLTFLSIIFVVCTLRTSMRANKITREMGIAQVRAYLSFVSVQLHIFASDRLVFLVSVSVDNTGKSPARDVVAKIKTIEFFGDPRKGSTIIDIDNTIEPRKPKDISVGKGFVPANAASKEDIGSILRTVRNVHFTVELTGRDVFHKSFTGTLKAMADKGLWPEGTTWGNAPDALIIHDETTQPQYDDWHKWRDDPSTNHRSAP